MVSLRDGKSYDPTVDASGGSSRRRSTTTATVSSAQRTVQTRRSARLAQASTDPTADEDNVPFQTPQAPPAPTPVRNKRQRPQQLTVVAEPAAGAVAGTAAEQDSDDLDTCDIGTTDQGMQLQEAADMELPADEPSPSAMHANKKPRIPTSRTPTPSKAASAASRQRRETLSVSIAAAVMVLVAAVAAGVLLPQLAPHREQFKASLQQTAAHTNAVYLQPFKHRALDGMNTATARLAAASAAAQQQVLALLLQAHVRWPGVIPSQLLSQHKGQPAGPAGGAWSASSLSSILPAGAQWGELAEDIADKMGAPPAQRNHKAPALLLACGSSDDCNEAAAALSVLPPQGEACALTIDSSNLPTSDAAQPAAALQALLAPFLKRCPAGLVILRSVEALPVGATPALHNALSELGGFQHDGAVDGSKAAYALLLQLHPAQVAAAAATADSAAAGTAIKDSFFEMLNAALTSGESGQDAAHLGVLQRAISTLHRRIEFAAPVRLGPSSEAALDELEAAAAAASANGIADDVMFGGDDDAQLVDQAEYESVEA